MRKILMRSAMPFEKGKSVSEVLIRNMVGNNTGNLLFQSSIARAVMTEDTEITTINTTKKFSDEQIEKFNTEYEMFLIPLANALRASFISQLEILTDLVSRLKIPSVVIGIGLQMNLDVKNWNFKFDEASKNFFAAVLEKSSMIGLRGEITGEYLKHLGFTEEKDFTVIGCPSLYRYGDSLPTPNLVDLTPDSKVTVNFKATLPPQQYDFIRKEAAKFQYTFVSQVVKEIKNIYVGYPYIPDQGEKRMPGDYPLHFTNELMVQNRMVGVLDDVSWLHYLKESDFNFGSRIHGDIAAILAGTPCFIIAGDGRVKELSDYHHIPYISIKEINDDTNIFDLYQKADYGYLLQGHKERVSHYLDFLDKNNIKHIDRERLNQKDTPFDRFWAEHPAAFGIIHPFPFVSPEEQERRICEFVSVIEEQKKQVQDNFQQYREEKRKILRERRMAQRKLEKELKEIKSSKFYKLKVKYDSIKSRF